MIGRRAVLGGLGVALAAPALARAQQDGFRAWLAGFRRRAVAQGLPPALVDSALAQASYRDDVIRLDRRQAEFVKPIWTYLDTAVSDTRVRNGRRALRRHRAVLARIEDRYGVPAEVITAIWGLESAYGTYRGDIPLVSSLATLAHDGRRGRFFEAQLIAALRILDSGAVTLAEFQGSWAGASGHTQFIPTSYLAHAVDFDGDGQRDIWSDDPTDALASAANYLAQAGWRTGLPWGVEVRLPDGFDYRQAGRSIRKPSRDWAALGLRATQGSLPPMPQASVLVPAGAAGAAFLISSNFAVIERYNTADAYVIAVGHLADRIAGGPPLQAGWPRQDRGLTPAERVELQRRLTALGFSTQGIDGRIGPRTIDATRRYQLARGLVPDGYASLRLLTRLRAER